LRTAKTIRPSKSYGRSKLANLLFTYELQRHFEQNQIDSLSVAAHPGISPTNLASHLEGKLLFKLLRPLFKIMSHEPNQGALPQIRAAVDPGVQGAEYYGPGGFREMKGPPVRVPSNGDSHNEEHARKLWDVSEEVTGVKFNF
jgi:NAD(P)-dependent dehydrogenase (short-subunit alcohol dehydrogenase family)